MTLASAPCSSTCRSISRIRQLAVTQPFWTRTTPSCMFLRPSRLPTCHRYKGLSTTANDTKPVGFKRNENSFEQYKASLNFPAETHDINDLWRLKPGTSVVVHGYIGPRRNISKKLTFQDVLSKDLLTAVQVVCFGGPSAEEPTKLDITKLPLHSPIVLKAVVESKGPAQSIESDNPTAFTRHRSIELRIVEALALNQFPTRDVLFTSDKNFAPEERNLEIRASHELRGALRKRSRVLSTCRVVFTQRGFIEVETPLLFKSTPEGAREFLVPTRQPGKVYALPQSPQQYKQILMSSGIPRYFQFARCFRDEDSRTDRQPEFTQIDLEMAFADEADVMAITEELVTAVWRRIIYKDAKAKVDFQKMTYSEAMSRYGSDKPDLRVAFEIHDATAWWPHDIMPFHDNKRIEILKASISTSIVQTHKFAKILNQGPECFSLVNSPKNLWIGVYNELSGLSDFPEEISRQIVQKAGIKHGDLVMVHREELKRRSGGWTTMGRLRLALHDVAVKEGFLPARSGFKFLWVNDFPLFSPSTEGEPGQGGNAGIASTHHPFTAPKTASDLGLLDEQPLEVTAAHYDLVVNGAELGGGSRRIHDAHVQEYVLRSVLGMSPERVEDFRHLLDALKMGCPPHAGIALGLDRLVAVLLGYDSIRNVIAFPKNNNGEDLLVKSPNQVTEAQLKHYHLKVDSSSWS